MHKLYYDLSLYYSDIEDFHRNVREEVQFLDYIFRENNVHSVFDLGCGTGDHLVLLKDLGYEVGGIDESEDMLKIARKRIPDGFFIKGKMQDFSIDRTFDAVISLFGSMDYLLTDKDVSLTIKNIKKLLRPSGIGIVEIWNDYPIRRIRFKPLSNVSTVISHNKVIHRNRGFKILEENHRTIIEVNYIYYIDNEEVKDTHIMRVFGYEEFLNFLRKAGFNLIKTYPNIHETGYKDISNRIIFVFFNE